MEISGQHIPLYSYIAAHIGVYTPDLYHDRGKTRHVYRALAFEFFPPLKIDMSDLWRTCMLTNGKLSSRTQHFLHRIFTGTVLVVTMNTELFYDFREFCFPVLLKMWGRVYPAYVSLYICLHPGYNNKVWICSHALLVHIWLHYFADDDIPYRHSNSYY